jgi:hypothetical protein
MPDIKEFKAKLEALAQMARQKLPEIATSLTITAKALAERRIKEEGFGAQYSESKIPAWFLKGKELNGAGTTFLEQHGVNPPGTPKKTKRKKKGEGLTEEEKLANWKEFRAAQGLQTGYVDLGYSNKMWAAMGPLSVVIDGDIYSAPLGASNTQAQKEMNYNYDRYGDFVGKGLDNDDFNVMGSFVSDELKSLLDQSNLQS